MPAIISRPLLLMLLLLLCACSISVEGVPSAADEESAREDAIPVETTPVTHRAMAAHYVGTATLEARAEAQVVARTSGVALAVLVEEGQWVEAGQALVRLDPDQARLRVAQTRAQMSKLDNSYRRALQLVAQKMISETDVDQLRFDLDSARAQYEAAELELSYTTVTAPMAGVIASRDVKPGNFVQIHSPIMRIVDLHHLDATLNVPEREIARLKPGQPVELAADALPGQVFAGVVDRVAPVVEAGTGTFRVVSRFSGGDGVQPGLQPGMFARLRIQYDARPDALAVPRTALVDDGGAAAVYVLRDGRAQRTAVTLGAEEGGWVELRGGVEAGEVVVTAGKATLRDGAWVEVLGAAPAGVAQASAAR